MASNPNSRKRKAPAPVPAPDEQFPSSGALEMLSEDEQDEEPESDDGDYEEFPEIDAASDTEGEEDEDEDEEENGEDEEEDSSSDASGNDEKLHIFPQAKVVISKITGEPKKVYPEIEPDYDSDSSTEDVSTSMAPSLTNPLDIHCVQDPNRIGNVPMHWYDDMPHIGYDINGKKVLRPAMGDELDNFLKTQEDPAAWFVLAGPYGNVTEFMVVGCLLWTRIPKQRSSCPRKNSILFADCIRTKILTPDTTHMNPWLNGSPVKGRRRLCRSLQPPNQSAGGFPASGRNGR